MVALSCIESQEHMRKGRRGSVLPTWKGLVDGLHNWQAACVLCADARELVQQHQEVVPHCCRTPVQDGFDTHADVHLLGLQVME